jgi:hypothetical protein
MLLSVGGCRAYFCLVSAQIGFIVCFDTTCALVVFV